MRASSILSSSVKSKSGIPFCVEIASVAELPSQFGKFRIYVFSNNLDHKEHVAIVQGDVTKAAGVPTRVHSECLTGDVFGSLRCDCRQQLELAFKRIGDLPQGILLYMRQEGRNIGLINKIRAYQLQEQGLDTIEANRALGFRDDERDYSIAATMLHALEVKSIQLMTNNPDKIEQLEKHGVVITKRLPHVVPASLHNRHYLLTKAKRAGHLIELD
ncbi:GTP cyclohydrolase II [Pajaroellobacter abortibovis]|uniref:GTP cyclohydrolase-2 n=1 Tax=Pajaroellobacter abortibovis TaxID=1882918 RepID=A0A1L6MYZ2_9BACT|nr:GTP cyclohydrolase II [Pajaroellobacter abortibovis]APS00648.1 GTP cyclohydrolase II [Pajaroellobacter abortibovis]